MVCVCVCLLNEIVVITKQTKKRVNFYRNRKKELQWQIKCNSIFFTETLPLGWWMHFFCMFAKVLLCAVFFISLLTKITTS